MPLRLSVGVSKKVGLPDYSSAGASCSLDLELPEGLLQADLAGFQERVRDAYVACHQAVNDELARLRPPAGPTPGPARGVEGTGSRNDSHPTDGRPDSGPQAGRPGPSRPATPSQVKAILTIARRQHADLEGLLCDHGVARPEELSLAEASRLIDTLKAVGGAR